MCETRNVTKTTHQIKTMKLGTTVKLESNRIGKVIYSDTAKVSGKFVTLLEVELEPGNTRLVYANQVRFVSSPR